MAVVFGGCAMTIIFGSAMTITTTMTVALGFAIELLQGFVNGRFVLVFLAEKAGRKKRPAYRPTDQHEHRDDHNNDLDQRAFFLRLAFAFNLYFRSSCTRHDVLLPICLTCRFDQTSTSRPS